VAITAGRFSAIAGEEGDRDPAAFRRGEEADVAGIIVERARLVLDRGAGGRMPRMRFEPVAQRRIMSSRRWRLCGAQRRTGVDQPEQAEHRVGVLESRTSRRSRGR
jgi:hypothetical protein